MTMAYTRFRTWVNTDDLPAAAFTHIEAGISSVADTADTAQTTANNISTRLITGTGSPEGIVTAPKGTIFLRTEAYPYLYIKESGSGNTGWQVQ